MFHEFPKSEKLGATLQNTHGSATGSLENMFKKSLKPSQVFSETVSKVVNCPVVKQDQEGALSA